MAELSTILPGVLKKYVEENENNVIDEAVSKSIKSGISEIDVHKSEVMSEIRKEFKKQRAIAGIQLLFIAVIFFAIGVSIFFYLQSDKQFQIEQQIQELSTLITKSNISGKHPETAEVKIINYQLTSLTMQVGKLHNLYITFITSFTGFLMLILAWILSSIQFKKQ